MGYSGADYHQFELSWLCFGQYYRPNTTTAWAQTMGVNLSTGYWTFYKGYGSSSDQSLKGDVQNASTEDCLNMLKSVRAKTYRRLDLPDGEGERLGCIAQDVEAACPSAWGNVVGRAPLKWSGNPDGNELATLDYARLVCPLFEDCRAMLLKIEQLEMRVEQLEA